MCVDVYEIRVISNLSIGDIHVGWGGEWNTLSKDAGPWREWIVISHIGWGGERNTIIRVWKPLPSRRILRQKEKLKEDNIC